MAPGSSAEPLRVIIAGGGVAGVEALIGLHHLAAGRVDVTLVARDDDFVYKPMVVAEPFAAGEAEHRALEPICRELGARFVQRQVTAVRPGERRVVLDGSATLDYDALVVCVGAKAVPAYRDAVTFHAGSDPLSVTEAVGGGARAHVAFVVPPGVAWSLPIYELALMARRRLQELGRGDSRCTIVTPEERPLALFGPGASAALEELLARRGVEVITSAYAHEDAGGRLALAPGARHLDADRVIALPVLHGPRLAGLPMDGDGFIPTDEWCRVREVAGDVFAAGDGTTFPIKQGGLATQQADAIVEQISARAGADVEPQPFRPVLRGMLLTGDTSLYARADVAGGGGEGVASEDYLWWPPHKIGGRFLSPWLSGGEAREDLEPPSRSLAVEVALPHEWHSEPMPSDG